MDIFDIVERGDLEYLKKAVSKGASINVKDNFGRTPLHEACWFGHLEVIKYLIEKGAGVNVKNKHGRTPLHLVIVYDYWNIVKYLLEKGAEYEEVLETLSEEKREKLEKIILLEIADMKIKFIHS